MGGHSEFAFATHHIEVWDWPWNEYTIVRSPTPFKLSIELEPDEGIVKTVEATHRHLDISPRWLPNLLRSPGPSIILINGGVE
jgi:hypothetical protein